MNLRTFLDAQPRGHFTRLAKGLGVSPVYLSQLAAGQGGREPSPTLCVAIETHTEKQVMRWDLRPGDWHLIWPELINQDSAPHPAGAAAEQGVA